MRCLSVETALILMLFVGPAHFEPAADFFKFRKSTLHKFNEARRILASGDIAKIARVFEGIPEFQANVAVDLLGPAADMYQLKWSRQLEQIGYEYVQEKKKATNVLESIEYKEHIGFYWMGDMKQVISSILKSLPLGALADSLNSMMEILETILMVIWIGVAAPKSTPLQKGAHFGPAEVLFAERFEIGCFSEILYSVCFLNKIPHRDVFFKEGVACTSCGNGTHCEFWEEADGTIEEGELCVPKKTKGEVNGNRRIGWIVGVTVMCVTMFG
ncbi:unnamed protein product [Caenorhabditis sp. 36 PRJEB53466]|nr:unnamed protein product [Caenorhabditis sp. 36 PRJEB53466]